MIRRTSTQQLQNAITNNLLKITKAEIHHKSSKQVDEISIDSLKESLDFLAETIFTGMIDWHFERSLNAGGEYIFDSGYRNPHSEDVVTVYLKAGENVVDREDIERTLLFVEEE